MIRKLLLEGLSYLLKQDDIFRKQILGALHEDYLYNLNDELLEYIIYLISPLINEYEIDFELDTDRHCKDIVELADKIDKEYEEGFKEEFINKLVNKLKDIVGEFFYFYDKKKLVYRAITLNEKYKDIYIDKLKKGDYSVLSKWFDGIGVYWADDEDAAITHWGDLKDKLVVIFEAEITENDVDWLMNISMATTSLWKEEREIRLKPNIKIHLNKIIMRELNNYRPINSKSFDVDIMVSTGSDYKIKMEK